MKETKNKVANGHAFKRVLCLLITAFTLFMLAGVDHSSGSSEWLKTLFLERDFDAMVNYESLILTANRELVKQGREPLYIVYPYDGLSISNAPLGYVNQGDRQREEIFLKLKEFIMSDSAQKEIQSYGRRTGTP